MNGDQCAWAQSAALRKECRINMRITTEDINNSKNNNPELAKPDNEEKKPEINSIRDEVKLQRAKMKDKPFKEKVKYFWKYYKIHTIITIGVLLFVFSLVHSIANKKTNVFLCFTINSYGLDSEVISQSFADYAGIDTAKYDCFISTSYSLQPKLTDTYALTASQAIDVQIASGSLDAMMVDSACFYEYALQSYFVDLRDVLSDADLEKYEPYFYYVDMADYEKAMENADEFGPDYSKVTSLTTMEERNEEGLTHKDPSSMTDPIPVGLFINESNFVSNTECYSNCIAVIGIPASSQHINTTIDFINFMWDDELKWESVY